MFSAEGRRGEGAAGPLPLLLGHGGLQGRPAAEPGGAPLDPFLGDPVPLGSRVLQKKVVPEKKVVVSAGETTHPEMQHGRIYTLVIIPAAEPRRVRLGRVCKEPPRSRVSVRGEVLGVSV